MDDKIFDETSTVLLAGANTIVGLCDAKFLDEFLVELERQDRSLQKLFSNDSFTYRLMETNISYLKKLVRSFQKIHVSHSEFETSMADLYMEAILININNPS